MRGKRAGGSNPAELLTTSLQPPKVPPHRVLGAERSCAVVVASSPPLSPPRKRKGKNELGGKEREQRESGIPSMALEQWRDSGPSRGAPATLAGQRFPTEELGLPSHGPRWSGMAGMGKGRGAAGACMRPRSPCCSSRGVGSVGCGENTWKRADVKKKRGQKTPPPFSNSWKCQ